MQGKAKTRQGMRVVTARDGVDIVMGKRVWMPCPDSAMCLADGLADVRVWWLRVSGRRGARERESSVIGEECGTAGRPIRDGPGTEGAGRGRRGRGTFPCWGRGVNEGRRGSHRSRPRRARVSVVGDKMAVERARQDGAGKAGGLTPQAPLGASRNRRAKGVAARGSSDCVREEGGYTSM
jgi:hypothetical protein